MDLRQLTFFVTICELRSFTRAAERLHIAQPAVSIAMRKLEEELGVRLLHRTPSERQVTPTAEGRALLAHARAILAQVDDARRELAALRGLEEGEVDIGVPTMLGNYRLPPVITAFRDRYPGIRLVVRQEGARAIQALVESGTLTLGVVANEDLPREELEWRPLLRAEIVVCMPPEHPFAELSAVPARRLDEVPLVLFPPGYYQRERLDALLTAAGLRPNIVCETNLVPLIKQLVAHGAGVGTLLRDAITPEDDLAVRPFDPPVHVEVAICWKHGRQLSPADRAFVEFLTEQCAAQA